MGYSDIAESYTEFNRYMLAYNRYLLIRLYMNIISANAELYIVAWMDKAKRTKSLAGSTFLSLSNNFLWINRYKYVHFV